MPSGTAEQRGDPGGALRSYFAEGGWDVVESDDGALIWAYSGSTGTWYGQVWWLAEAEQLLVYAICADKLPAKRRTRLVNYVNEVNTDLVVGSFEVDAALRFRVGVPVASADLSPDLVRRTVETAVATVEAHRAPVADLLQ